MLADPCPTLLPLRVSLVSPRISPPTPDLDRPRPMPSWILRQPCHRFNIPRVRPSLPLQRTHRLARILSRPLLVPKHGVDQRRPRVRRPQIRVQPLGSVQLNQLPAHLGSHSLCPGLGHDGLDFVLQRVDLADASIGRSGFQRREGALRAGAVEAPFAELGLALGSGGLAVDVADGEFLADRDVPDRDGGMG